MFFFSIRTIHGVPCAYRRAITGVISVAPGHSYLDHGRRVRFTTGRWMTVLPQPTVQKLRDVMNVPSQVLYRAVFQNVGG